MHCTLLIPDLLPPRDAGAGPDSGFRPPQFAKALARGNTTQCTALTREEWLCAQFGVPRQQDFPLAALMLKADGGDPASGYWLCADPIQLRVDRNRLIIAGRAEDFTAAEALELTNALNRHFAPDDLLFFAPAPSRWYVRATAAPRLVTTPLARALNRSVKHHLPQGHDALAWHRVMNEAQMIMHAHPVTAAREARGATAANSIWLSGGGTLPSLATPPYATAWGGDALTRALASFAGIAHHDLPADGANWLAIAADGHHLLEFDAAANALRAGDAAGWRAQIEVLDEKWIGPLLAALRAKKIDAFIIIAGNDEKLLEVTITPGNLWRFWRRARPLADYADKA